MREYVKPTIETIELQPEEAIACHGSGNYVSVGGTNSGLTRAERREIRRARRQARREARQAARR